VRVPRVRTGWRLAKASLALLRSDRTLAIFPLLSTIAIVVALAIALTPGLLLEAALDEDWVVLPFMLIGGYVATFLAVHFNVALVGAARVAMDGRDATVRDGLAVARGRRGPIARWALLQFTFGILTRVAQRSSGGGPASLFFGLAGVAWSVASFFAVPVIALEGLGPGAALKRSASLVRERWGEGLVGYTAINTAVLLVGALPVMVFAGAIDPAFDVGKGAGAVVLFATIVTFIGACTLASALGMLFRVELYRYSTQGDLSGGFPQADVAAAFGPPKASAG
jgi:hypothetical protein